MKKFSALLSVLLLSITGLLSIQVQAKTPLPIDNWAIRHGIADMEVSPDGKHIFVLKLENKNAKNILEIYSVDDLSKPLKRLGSGSTEFLDARWVSDHVIAGGTWTWVRKQVKGPEDSAIDGLLYSYDLRKDKFKNLEPEKKDRFSGTGFTIVNNLTDEPDHILIATGTEVGAGLGIDPFQRFRPRSYFRYNLKTGGKRLVLKGNEKYGNIRFNGKGEPTFASGQNITTKETINFYRLPGDKTWKEFGRRRDADNYDDLYDMIGGASRIVGKVKDHPNLAWIIDNNGEDKASLWEYDLVNDKFGRKIFQAKDSDVIGTLGHSNTWGEGEEGDVPVVAAIYPGAKRERHWFDMKEKALYEQFEAKIPNSHNVSITSRSRDGKSMIVTNNGPRDPGSYWLVIDGKMGLMGNRNPLLKAEDLSDVKYIRYKARDGMVIPAYLTTPNTGTAPYPLVVLPHGGPHVNEVIGFDEWGQMLANNGYMVLQPQYRMSTGWGKKHFDSALGQHGLAMQDDKDDGAQYLIDQGLVDKDRIAMFGWSYGGYAALVAASRSPNMYQCVIAGAAVADARKGLLKGGGLGGLGVAIKEWVRSRGGYIGINPIDEVEKVNVPVFMIHPKLDSRVLYFNYKDYKKAMEKHGKPGRYLSLKQAEHFSVFMSYKVQKQIYTGIIDFLENDCGPGGL